METITDFEIINHWWHHNQYFQGCGRAFTSFACVATGAGFTAKEAYDDAVEQIASAGCDVSRLPKRPKGIRARDHVPAAPCGEDPERYWYVSIRYNTKTEEG